MKLQDLLRLARTLWYLRGSQFSGQIRQALLPKKGPRSASGTPPIVVASPKVPFLAPAAHIHTDGLGQLRLVNQEVRWPTESGQVRIDWNHSEKGPLWAYHLHQFDWVRHPGLRPEERGHAIEAWRTEHTSGIGWSPFPISLRTFSWGKLLTSDGALPEDSSREAMVSSLADQLATLSDQPETHLLANHYLWNLLALVFGGVLLDGSESDAWRQVVPRLLEELEEQVPADGAHYERSPSYHVLLLENLLDLLNLCAGTPGRIPDSARQQLEATASRMLGALEFFLHPDAEVALFGDSAFGIASRPADVLGYGKALGLSSGQKAPPSRLLQAGFARLENPQWTLLVSSAPPTPDYQPGHAHCDAMAFELSIGTQRVVTDTGVFEYVPGPARDAARATASHATVVVEGQEQAELWAAHRIGGRPDAAIPRVTVNEEGGGRIECVCAGWATPEVLQRRSFELAEDTLTLVDTFDRAAEHAAFLFPLAPGLDPQMDGNSVHIALENGSLDIEWPEGLQAKIEQGPYFPEFGRREERAILRVEGTDLTEVSFVFRRS